MINLLIVPVRLYIPPSFLERSILGSWSTAHGTRSLRPLGRGVVGRQAYAMFVRYDPEYGEPVRRRFCYLPQVLKLVRPAIILLVYNMKWLRTARLLLDVA